jgi:hypothetical protein
MSDEQARIVGVVPSEPEDGAGSGAHRDARRRRLIRSLQGVDLRVQALQKLSLHDTSHRKRSRRETPSASRPA